MKASVGTTAHSANVQALRIYPLVDAAAMPVRVLAEWEA
jgi:hypothetical protein